MSERRTGRKTIPPIRFVRLREVMARTGLARNTIHVWAAEGRFPKPVPLGARSVGWVESELEDRLHDRIAAR